MKNLFYLLLSLLTPFIKIALGCTTWNIFDLLGTIVMLVLWVKDKPESK